VSTDNDSAPPSTKVGWGLLAAALGFVLLYLSVNVVTSVVTTPLPMPDAPTEEVRAWYVDNGFGATLIGVCQFLSVASLGVFVVRFHRVAAAGRRLVSLDRARTAGLVAVALMMASSVVSWLLIALAADASLGTVSALRTASFVAGGTAHVLALGVFVLLSIRTPGMSKPVRVLGYVAAVPAVASVVSLVWFQGAVLILLGRLLCMVWTVTVAVSLARRKA
jgi:hypothetical protein